MTCDLMDLLGPALLAWARTTAHMSIEEAAAGLGVAAGTIDAWENGTAKPTLSQLRSLGRICHRKVGLLFLPAPPLDSALGLDGLIARDA